MRRFRVAEQRAPVVAVMPRGVEHLAKFKHNRSLRAPVVAVMPRGVEHSAPVNAPDPFVDPVVAVMPRGVEHAMIAVRASASTARRRRDAARR